MLSKPEWLRVRYAQNPNTEAVEKLLVDLKLNTVCKEAHCPNCAECFSRKTATLMIMGKNCTRNCRFCNVRNDDPQELDPGEPKRVAAAVRQLGIMYVVVTSVTRDDLPDGGASHFARTIRAIKKAAPDTVIEVLIPDFNGSLDALKTVADAKPHVISHNMETVRALYLTVRPKAQYESSLDLLRNIKLLNPNIYSKSGIMVGLGETKVQVYELFSDLLDVGADFLTIGQYLSPSKNHIPVHEYIEPCIFDEYGAIAREMGFKFVASAPLVRSSYHAGAALGIKPHMGTAFGVNTHMCVGVRD